MDTNTPAQNPSEWKKLNEALFQQIKDGAFGRKDKRFWVVTAYLPEPMLAMYVDSDHQKSHPFIAMSGYPFGRNEITHVMPYFTPQKP